jgi:hypothetical protein
MEWVQCFINELGKTCQLPSTLPIFNFFFSFIHHPTLSKQKKRKRKLVSSPLPSPKKEKKGLVPTHNPPQIQKMDLYPISNPPKK